MSSPVLQLKERKGKSTKKHTRNRENKPQTSCDRCQRTHSLTAPEETGVSSCIVHRSSDSRTGSSHGGSAPSAYRRTSSHIPTQVAEQQRVQGTLSGTGGRNREDIEGVEGIVIDEDSEFLHLDRRGTYEEVPPYHATLHKYLDLISFDPRIVPCLRINRSLVRSQAKLSDAIIKFKDFNLFPSAIDPWYISHVDDRHFEDLIPELLSTLPPEQDQSESPASLAEEENLRLAIRLSLQDY